MAPDRPHRDDMEPHVEHLKALAAGCRSIVEFGVGTSVSTLALLDGLPPDGTLVSVDIGTPSIHPDARNDPRWTYINGSSIAIETIRRLPHRPDLVWIDSGHDYELTWRELLVADVLRPPRIALHDYLFPIADDPRCRVKEATDQFLELGHYEWEVLHESRWGLAVLARK